MSKEKKQFWGNSKEENLDKSTQVKEVKDQKSLKESTQKSKNPQSHVERLARSGKNEKARFF